MNQNRTLTEINEKTKHHVSGAAVLLEVMNNDKNININMTVS